MINQDGMTRSRVQRNPLLDRNSPQNRTSTPRPGVPVAPQNRPGVNQQPAPVRTYVAPPPPPRPMPAQQPVAVSQPPVQYNTQAPAPAPAPAQAQVPQTTTPPAFTGYNWAGVNTSGQPDTFRPNVEGMSLQELQSYIANRAPGHPSRTAIEGIMSQALARFGQGGSGGTGGPGTPPPPPQNQYGWPIDPNNPGVGPGGSQLPRTYDQWLGFLGPDAKSETKLALVEMLMNQENRDAALGDRDRAFGILQGAGQNPDPMRSLVEEALTQRMGQPSQVPGMDQEANAALRSSLMGRLQNSNPISQQAYEGMQTQIREDARRRREQNLSAMGQDFARRGLEGGAVDSYNLQAMMEADASRDTSLRDLMVQRELAGAEGLASAQSALGGYLGDNYNQQLSAANLANQGQMDNMNLANQISLQNYGRQADLASLLAGTQRGGIDLSGLMNVWGTQRRPLPQSSESDQSGNALIAALLGGAGAGIGAFAGGPAGASAGWGIGSSLGRLF